MNPNPHANPIPNILTGIRLFAGVIMFLIMAGATLPLLVSPALHTEPTCPPLTT